MAEAVEAVELVGAVVQEDVVVRVVWGGTVGGLVMEETVELVEVPTEIPMVLT